MGRTWTTAACTALCAWLAGCSASIPEGVYACASETDCPADFVCSRGEDDDRDYCYRSAQAQAGSGDGGRGGAAGDAGMPVAGADAGPPAPVAPTATGFTSLGGVRSGGGLRLYDERFERGERRCTTDGRLCVTGGFEP